MRRLDKSTAVSPGCWKGGRPQRARHMSAVRSGTEMSPCPRGYSSPARDASHCHDAVVVSGVVVRWSGSLGSPAARRKQQGPLATRRGRRAPHWSGFTAAAARHQASPSNPLRAHPSLYHRSRIAHRSSRARARQGGQRRGIMPIVFFASRFPSCSLTHFSPFTVFTS